MPHRSNGWTLYFYPIFEQRYEDLRARVLALEQRLTDKDFSRHRDVKLYESLIDVITRIVPSDPGDASFRLGGSLGAAGTNWRRVKGHGLPSRHRLFFRFDGKAKVIVYCWLNDDSTLRKAGAASDPYALFSAMLKRRKPPPDLDSLLLEVTEAHPER